MLSPARAPYTIIVALARSALLALAWYCSVDVHHVVLVLEKTAWNVLRHACVTCKLEALVSVVINYINVSILTHLALDMVVSLVAISAAQPCTEATSMHTASTFQIPFIVNVERVHRLCRLRLWNALARRDG